MEGKRVTRDEWEIFHTQSELIAVLSWMQYTPLSLAPSLMYWTQARTAYQFKEAFMFCLFKKEQENSRNNSSPRDTGEQLKLFLYALPFCLAFLTGNGIISHECLAPQKSAPSIEIEIRFHP
jgi:hypothetical protein